MKEFFTQSKNMSHEYCATVVRLGEILPIEGANNVAQTLVNGRTIVISKDHTEGDLMIYCSNETQLNEDFLSTNNLFEDIVHNRNYEEVQEWLDQNTDATDDERKEYLRHHRGYFDKHGRVRMKKLAKTLSMGILFELDVFKNWCPSLDVDLNDLVGYDFDTINGELFIKAYVPPMKGHNERLSRDKRRNKKLFKFDRMIPGEFSFHYDTQQFERNVNRFKPDDIVAISTKVHGTSSIIGNVKVKFPKYGGLYSKLFVYLPKFLQFTREDYDIVKSSRSVIINSDINPNKGIGYAGGDVQKVISIWADKIGKYIPKGYTVYSEIIGYYEDSNTFIQKVGNGYDYGCNPGQNKIMPYRVTIYDGETKKEANIEDVIAFTNYLKDCLEKDGHADIADMVMKLDVLYYGKLSALYPELDAANHWHENLLEKMKNDKEHFGMEQNEPLCRLQVPREGVVIRIEDDIVPEAFKLKCLKFLGKEAEAIDKGECVDAEMEERYE